MSNKAVSKHKQQGRILIEIARAAIASGFGQSLPTASDADWLQQIRASFVTLTTSSNNQLRGCMGTLHAHQSLLEDVRHNAKAAAFKDHRFTPLTEEEFSQVSVEVSVLSAIQSLAFDSETEALQQLQPDIDGVVFHYRNYRSTFLPQVWEQLHTAREFMAHLKQKAGLAADFWSDEITLQRYTVSKWKQQDYSAGEISGV